jgi:hypothetical protein
MAEDLVDAIERFISAKLLNERLKNPESSHALDTARRALVEEFGGRHVPREVA